jgi:glycosyltransferase involved in cell wall biosynthesis
MKIAVVNNMAPFVWGGAEEHAAELATRLRARGHLVDEFRLPFFWEPLDAIPGQIVAAEQTRLDAADKVIAHKFPAYLVPHADKTLWLFHQFRQAYDLLETDHTAFGPGADDAAIREAIIRADETAFEGSRQIFTNAANVSERLVRFNGVASEVLLPPMIDGELFTGDTAEPYVFAGGRVNDMKRQELLIRALALTPSSVRLVIAGPPDDASVASRLERLAEDLGVTDRLRLDLRFAPREEIANLVNRASACAYVPFDEDAIGYVTLEAAEAGKPVVTTTDSGGVRALVHDGDSGWVVEPDAESLAQALTEALARPAETRHRGERLRDSWHAMDVTWSSTIDRLLA